jgi:hypothetical protein
MNITATIGTLLAVLTLGVSAIAQGGANPTPQQEKELNQTLFLIGSSMEITYNHIAMFGTDAANVKEESERWRNVAGAMPDDMKAKMLATADKMATGKFDVGQMLGELEQHFGEVSKLVSGKAHWHFFLGIAYSDVMMSAHYWKSGTLNPEQGAGLMKQGLALMSQLGEASRQLGIEESLANLVGQLGAKANAIVPAEVDAYAASAKNLADRLLS